MTKWSNLQAAQSLFYFIKCVLFSWWSYFFSSFQCQVTQTTQWYDTATASVQHFFFCMMSLKWFVLPSKASRSVSRTCTPTVYVSGVFSSVVHFSHVWFCYPNHVHSYEGHHIPQGVRFLYINSMEGIFCIKICIHPRFLPLSCNCLKKFKLQWGAAVLLAIWSAYSWLHEL